MIFLRHSFVDNLSKSQNSLKSSLLIPSTICFISSVLMIFRIFAILLPFITRGTRMRLGEASSARDSFFVSSSRDSSLIFGSLSSVTFSLISSSSSISFSSSSERSTIVSFSPPERTPGTSSGSSVTTSISSSILRPFSPFFLSSRKMHGLVFTLTGKKDLY
uniref:Uncharacterized protein n=1 Tax=Phlebotomus papatasi TaxID=29031 RepID=A0A1B0D555_PHLPP